MVAISLKLYLSILQSFEDIQIMKRLKNLMAPIFLKPRPKTVVRAFASRIFYFFFYSFGKQSWVTLSWKNYAMSEKKNMAKCFGRWKKFPSVLEGLTLWDFLLVDISPDIISVDSSKQHVINSHKNFLIQPINQADNADIIMRAKAIDISFIFISFSPPNNICVYMHVCLSLSHRIEVI